ncbi:MAG: hypothetical protein HY313_06095 [Acidobacteria bacterium]|nr:hypothetical protein [Acidobacteriota bacterium]
MSPELETSIVNYLTLVETLFQEGKAESGSSSSVRLLMTEDQLLVRLVKEAEGATAFLDLTQTTAQEFLGDQSDVLELEVRNYFRLSGIYQVLFNDEPWERSEVFLNYEKAFTSKTYRVTHLAPIQLVDFSADLLDCGTFRIQRFSKEELDHILRNRVKRVFYPEAYVDLEKISHYWFICVTENVSVTGKLGMFTIFIPVGRKPALDSVALAIKHLMLYTWEPSGAILSIQREDQTVGFLTQDGIVPPRPRFPLVISTWDSLIHWPQSCPDFSRLELKIRGPRILHEGKVRETWMDLEIGAEGEAEAEFPLHEAEKTAQFAAVMKQVSKMLTEINARGWNFMNTALDFLFKAFISDDKEGLLWSITAIEAVLGEKVDYGLTRLLRTRISRILASSPQEIREIKKRFNNLYEFRSNLVHGNTPFEEKSHLQYLYVNEAWEMARAVVLWMLGYLNHVAQHLPDGVAEVPSREDLLKVFDMDLERRRRTAKILQALPDSFPNVPEWWTVI